jgi:hypothetical protein
LRISQIKINAFDVAQGSSINPFDKFKYHIEGGYYKAPLRDSAFVFPFYNSEVKRDSL